MRALTPALFALCCSSTACSGDRLAQLEVRQQELQLENERLARDLKDLRAQKTAGDGASPRTAAADTDRELWASLRATLSAISRQMLPAGAMDGKMEGVWRHTATDGTQLVIHYGRNGGLCGWRRSAAGAKEKLPFWGRWERHDRMVLELRDRWTGDHNEHDGEVQALESLSGDKLVRQSPTRMEFARVPDDERAALGGLFDDPSVPIPGLPKWCFGRE